MTAAVAISSILVFVLGFWKAGIVPVAREAIAIASRAAGVMTDKAADDDTKEKAARAAALGLLVNAASILWRSALVLVAAAVPIYAAELAGWVESRAVIGFLSRWDVIIVASIVMLVAYLMAHRYGQSHG